MNEPAPERESQNRRALRELRQLILSGELEAGAKLSEVALASRLGISRTPLRQAMTQLAEETLLDRTSTGRWVVASFSIDDVSDAIELRGVMEGTAARLAAERGIDPDAARAARKILDDIDELVSHGTVSDFDRYAALNDDFHSLLAALPQSWIIKRELDRVKRLPVASPNAFVVGRRPEHHFLASLGVAQAQHRALLDAIVSREGSRAESLAREHARLALDNLATALQAGAPTNDELPGLALIVDAPAAPTDPAPRAD